MTPEHSGNDGEAVGHILEESRKSRHVVLNLSHSKIKVVPLEISKLSFLKVLLLNNNSIIMPPDEIVHLQQLECLSLEHNELTLVPSGISKLQSLLYLNLSYNKLGCLPPSVLNLKNLKELWLAHIGLSSSSFPSELSSLCQLERLSLEGNNISSVGENIGGLLNLKWLSLSKNHLTELGDSVRQLMNLRILLLQENHFQQFPRVLLSLTQLTNLNLRKNRISHLPASVTDFLVSSNQFSKVDLRENGLQEQLEAKPVWMELDFLFVGTWSCHNIYADCSSWVMIRGIGCLVLRPYTKKIVLHGNQTWKYSHHLLKSYKTWSVTWPCTCTNIHMFIYVYTGRSCSHLPIAWRYTACSM